MRTCFCTMQRTGKAAPRNGAKSGGGNNAPSGLYPSKGGGSNDYVYLTTSRANPEHWSRLMKLIGREELIEDPRFATGNDRVAHEKELDAIIGEWTRQHDKREAMEKLIAVGVPSGAVFDTMELQNEPTFQERGIMQIVHHRQGDYKMATWPVRIDGKTVKLKPSPGLGQDSAEVLGNWLGIGAAEVDTLRSEGVL
jgi:crotonobetainyl-CoA:carnitine CoA-transferase CaiB-like acyl-CoA transferase